MREKGLVPIVIFIIIVLIGGVLFFIVKPKIFPKKTSETQESVNKGLFQKLQISKENPESETATPSPSISNPTPPPTNEPTPTSSPSPTAQGNPYDLTSATGAVKVTVIPQAGKILIGDQIVELVAQPGYKVLVNKSAEKDTRIARQGDPSVNFSQAPPGPYTVRARYQDQWTNYYSLSVSSGELTSINITVSGSAPTPSPTPKPKPICYEPIVYPYSPRNAPFNAILQPQGSSGSAGTINGYQWDFTGDGTWDSGISLNAQNYTYQSPGTYTVRMRVLASNGEYSDTCQTIFTVN